MIDRIIIETKNEKLSKKHFSIINSMSFS